jgi:adenylosuccinate lyase
MISRYTRPEMGRIWELENQYAKWLEVEIAACESMSEQGLIPKAALKTIKEKARFSVARILEIEEETKHDVIAFLTNVEESVGPDSRYIHLGLTSSDILDTSFALLLKEAMELILEAVKKFMEVIKRRAYEHKNTVMIGRSHGIHAEPITFGLKLAVWYAEMDRNLKRLMDAKDVIAHGKLSGAVGTFANISPGIEALTMERLGLKPAKISTQIIQRDRHAQYFTSLAILAGTLEKISVELRHLQRTEVLEAEEAFSKGQKGSSAMPHKKNPVGSENISGLARLVRSNCLAAMENITLWHERDISHSSVERVIGPDSTILIHYMLLRTTGIVDRLVVHADRMIENLNKMRGLIFSQQILVKLATKGLERQQAYVMVQRNAMKVWEGGREFKGLILEDQEIGRYLSKDEIEEIFDIKYHLKYVDDIFSRVFPLVP